MYFKFYKIDKIIKKKIKMFEHNSSQLHENKISKH